MMSTNYLLRLDDKVHSYLVCGRCCYLLYVIVMVCVCIIAGPSVGSWDA